MKNNAYYKFKAKLTKQDRYKIQVLGHPMCQANKNFEFVIGLTRRLRLDEHDWLNKRVKGKYSTDNCSAGNARNISFERANDAAMFKLIQIDLACPRHP